MEPRQRLKAIEDHPAFGAAMLVLSRLQAQGFEAVLAGGCVRDALRGVVPQDLDLATSATPDEVETLFKKTQPIGKAFGTILVIEGGALFEVTTFREDGEYADGRRPSEVRFSDMKTDSSRRDFTINSMFYDPVREIIFDYWGGRADLEKQVIRSVGSAHLRYQEDHLRMLRGLRFQAQLGFSIDRGDLEAIAELAPLLQKLSAERVWRELKKLLEGEWALFAIKSGIETKLLLQIFAELKSLKSSELKKTFLIKVHKIFPVESWQVGLAGLSLLLKLDVAVLKKSLKMSASEASEVGGLLDFARNLKGQDMVSHLKALDKLPIDRAAALAFRLISLGIVPSSKIENLFERYLVLTKGLLGLPKPWVSGQDLLKMGAKPGPEMGECLDRLYSDQLLGKLKSQESALQTAKKWLSKKS